MYNEEERENICFHAGVKLVATKDGQVQIQRDIENSRLSPSRSREYFFPMPVAYFNMSALV
jgi:hypothetical protein